MKKQVKLPKELHLWLASLKKGLRKLSDEDRDDILLSYVEQFNEELNEGKTVEQIKDGLRPIPEIVNEIYDELNVDAVIKIKDKKAKNVVKVKISSPDENKPKTKRKVITAFSFLLSLGSWTLTIVMGAIAILLPITAVAATVMVYINFDPYYATSLAVIFLGILPFVGVLLFFFTKGLYRTSVKMVNPFKERKQKKFGIKLWVILLIVGGILSALILGIGIGTTYKDGYIDSSIHDKYQHQQELLAFKNYQELTERLKKDNSNNNINEEMVKEYFSHNPSDSKFSIGSNHYYREALPNKEHNPDQLDLKIVRDYNLKESYQLDVKAIEIKVIWNNSVPGIAHLKLILPDLEWFNYVTGWQSETLEFIYN